MVWIYAFIKMIYLIPLLNFYFSNFWTMKKIISRHSKPFQVKENFEMAIRCDVNNNTTKLPTVQ